MKKFAYIIVVSLLIGGCSAPTNHDDQLSSLKKQREEYVKKIEEIDQQIMALDESLPESSTKSPINVKVLELKPELFRHYIEVQGMVESDNNIFIPAESPGIVQKLYVEEGDIVKKGDILAQIDATILLSSIEEVKLGLELATTVYERQKRLWDQNIGSEIQYLQAKNNKEGLEKKLATLNEQYEMTQIISPIDGVVDEIVIKEGEMAPAGFGAIRVVQMSDLKIKADVSEKYINYLKKGDLAQVSIPGLDISFNQRLSTVSKVINPDTRTFTVELMIPANLNEIRHNMLAVIRINDYTNEEAITVPVNVVQNSGSEKFLFVAQKNDDGYTAMRKTIEPGKMSDNKFEIVKNLSAGEKIITVGYQNLANGQPIQIID